MTPVAYISPNGILYKQLPPDSMLQLTPLFKELNDLSDEKILSVAKLIDPLNGCSIEEAFVYFAKAILKEARGE
jgi:hypothetical protein